jgi:hypothetical protein
MKISYTPDRVGSKNNTLYLGIYGLLGPYGVYYMFEVKDVS